MHSGFDAVVHFQIKLGKLVLGVSRGLLDISQTTGIDNVSDNETLDGLILGDSLSSGDTAHALDVASALLVSSVIASFDSHDFYFNTVRARAIERSDVRR
jgi:hypothetical protein